MAQKSIIYSHLQRIKHHKLLKNKLGFMCGDKGLVLNARIRGFCYLG